MNDIHSHATDGQLRILAYESEDTLEVAEIARHVEYCDTCQIRLTELTTDPQMERDASQWLRAYQPLDRGLSQDSRFQSPVGNAVASESGADSLDQGMLEPPTHPEMLGRIGRYEIERRIGSGGMGVV